MITKLWFERVKSKASEIVALWSKQRPGSVRTSEFATRYWRGKVVDLESWLKIDVRAIRSITLR